MYIHTRDLNTVYNWYGLYNSDCSISHDPPSASAMPPPRNVIVHFGRDMVQAQWPKTYRHVALMIGRQLTCDDATNHVLKQVRYVLEERDVPTKNTLMPLLPSASSSTTTDSLLHSTANKRVPSNKSTSAEHSRPGVKKTSKTSIMTATMFFALAAAALCQSLNVLAQSTMSPPANSADEEVVHYGPGYQDPISEYDVPYGLQQILASNSTAWRYPTDLTRNISPVG